MTRPTPPSASWQAPARLPQPWRAGERLRDPRALPPKKTERFLGLTCGKQRHQVFMAKLDDASATRSLPLTTIAPAQSASLHRADKRSDFGLYSHQSRPLAEYSRSLGTLLVPPPLSRSASFRGLVTLRQTFSHRSQQASSGTVLGLDQSLKVLGQTAVSTRAYIVQGGPKAPAARYHLVSVFPAARQ